MEQSTRVRFPMATEKNNSWNQTLQEKTKKLKKFMTLSPGQKKNHPLKSN